MWKKWIQSLSKDNPYVKLQPPAEEAQIAAAEKQLNINFPEELRCLLSALNGDCYLCFSAEEIAETNLLVRKAFADCYEGLENLLFIAGNGCGDYYGYEIKNGCVITGKILRWDHEENTTAVIANDLKEMICLYYSDRI